MCVIVACLFFAIPYRYNAEETLSTCRFGQRAKRIQNKAVVNAELSVGQYKIIVENLRAQQDRFQKAIEDLAAVIRDAGLPYDPAPILARLNATSATTGAGTGATTSSAKPSTPLALTKVLALTASPSKAALGASPAAAAARKSTGSTPTTADKKTRASFVPLPSDFFYPSPLVYLLVDD